MEGREDLAILGNTVPKLNISPQKREGNSVNNTRHFSPRVFLLLFSSAVIFLLNYTRATLSSNCFIADSLSGKIW